MQDNCVMLLHNGKFRSMQFNAEIYFDFPGINRLPGFSIDFGDQRQAFSQNLSFDVDVAAWEN